MSISFNLYTFQKKDNSTVRPTGTGTAISGYSREPLSIMSPVVGFNLNSAPSYNYAYSSDLGGRYYFISDWTFSENLWYATMRTDVLATYKTQIGNSTEYVIRSSAVFDGDIMDTYYPLKAGSTILHSFFEDSNGNRPWPQSSNPNTTGWYVIGLVNGDGNSIGGVSYYCLDNTNFRNLMATLLNSTNWTSMDFTTGEISEELYKSLFNPMQYMVSCMWTPFTPSMSSAMSAISFGWWTLTGINAYYLSSTTTYAEYTAPIYAHPQASNRGAFLNTAPFTRLSVTSGPFGVTPLDTSLYAHASSVAIQAYYDHVTGKALINIGPYNQEAGMFNIDKQLNTVFGVPIQLSQVNFDAVGAVQGGLSALGGFGGGALGAITSGITGNAAGVASSIIGGITSAASGVVSAAASMLPQVSTSGLNGAFSQFFSPLVLQMEHWNAVNEDNDHRGRPFCRKVRLGTIPGFIMVEDPQLATPGTDEETFRAREFMASGFYYE